MLKKDLVKNNRILGLAIWQALGMYLGGGTKMTKEELYQLSFQLILHSGNARSLAMEAIFTAKEKTSHLHWKNFQRLMVKLSMPIAFKHN